jgi:hypothetical protein
MIFLVFLFCPVASAGECPEPKLIKWWDKDNVDEIKDMLHPSTYMRVKEWGLKIPEYERVPWELRGSWKEATEKYSKECRLDEKGMLVNWKGGFPFPDPQNTQEIMWNYKRMNNGDDRYVDEDLYLVSFAGPEKKIRVKYCNYKMIGRVESTPVPEAPNNPKRYDYKRSVFITDPFELRGFGTLEYSYEDETKESDFWMYIPSMRRVRRASAAARQDTWDGTEVIFDDFDQFSGRIIEHEYKLLGKIEKIYTNHCFKPFEREQKQPLFWCYTRGPIYVIEAIPKDPDYIYSKRVFWVKPDSFNMAGVDIYDRRGELWKYVNFPTMSQGCIGIDRKDVTRFHGNPDVVLGVGGWSCDFVLGHCTFFKIDDCWYDTNYFPEENYKPSYLKKLGR